MIVHDETGRTVKEMTLMEFFKEYPLFRTVATCKVFCNCIENGKVFIARYVVKTFKGNQELISYNDSLEELLEEIEYFNLVLSGR